MKCVIVTPFGPGHETVVNDCVRSVDRAFRKSHGPFDSIRHATLDDSDGRLGCGGAKNKIVAESLDADWFFFLDADDEADPRAFLRFEYGFQTGALAVFGPIYVRYPGSEFGVISANNRWPIGWNDLMRFGPDGTIAMGCFFRADVVRSTPFAETRDTAEDFDFYLRALYRRRWVKMNEPIALIRADTPSSHGPNGFVGYKWGEACQKVVDRWKLEHAV